ncbi:ParB/RepB/Spo0J family partition protein [Pulveribacter sp.]|uniref:ParB/RepB/Spo0J family partition protein n=1 Tax=Pulveribacter sp. TaxID=2678893 RepID=UPI0028A9B7E4|nr:ParB/RepB/Spo0J family partition protein [Pulveribacter sp.]
MIDFGALPKTGSVERTGAAARPKTAPGALMAHTNDQRSELLRENERLKGEAAEASVLRSRVEGLSAELQEWEGAKAARLIDPHKIQPSRWANRHQSSFQTGDYEALKQEIAAAGGNVQAIKVRPRSENSTADQQYEIIFGHRRHQACLELGLPVLAVVESLSDPDLFVEMDRENRVRKDLSPWEQGTAYRRALEMGLFPSNRKLAEAVGADLSQVGKALSLATLPQEVVEAFASPLQLQFRWAKPLADACKLDREALINRAKHARGMGPDRTPAAVLRVLLDQNEAGGGTVLPPVEIMSGGQCVATIAMDARARVTVNFDKGAIKTRAHLDKLSEVLEEFVRSLKNEQK